MIQRIIQFPEKRSFFLFGPRQTGKSSLIKSRYGDASWTVSLLHAEEYARYAKNPGQYRLDVADKVKAGIIRFILDEVQRIPELLNEVHALTEQFPALQFILLDRKSVV